MQTFSKDLCYFSTCPSRTNNLLNAKHFEQMDKNMLLLWQTRQETPDHGEENSADKSTAGSFCCSFQS